MCTKLHVQFGLWHTSLREPETIPKSLQPFGKRVRPIVDLATVAGAFKSSSLLYTRDRRTGDAYLIDTGADRSTIPPTVSDHRRHRSDNVAWAANNTPIRTYGERRVMLDLGFRRTFTWVFLIADVVVVVVVVVVV